MNTAQAHTLPKSLGTFQLWGIAVGLVPTLTTWQRRGDALAAASA